MIFGGEFVAGIDLVDVCLWLFTIFFLFLVLYLQREGMREGYPTEPDTPTPERGRAAKPFYGPTPKTYKLPHGRDDVTVEFSEADTRDLALKRTAPWPGAPFVPTGDPMADGVGPASYAERKDYPDLTLEGLPRIAPFRVSEGYYVPNDDVDPRGLRVIAGDGKVAGEVVDLWVDRSEAIIRYYEVEVPLEDGNTRRVLLPVPFARICKRRLDKWVQVDAIFAAHFPKVPAIKSPDSVTRLEEDKIQGFYGGGKLYASRQRQEPLL